MAAGDAINTAARIQSAAPVNGVLVGDLTYRATRDLIEYRPAEPIAAKGKSEPVRVWEAVQALGHGGRRRGREAQIVGRVAELDRLLELWHEVGRERLPWAEPRLIELVPRAAPTRRSRSRRPSVPITDVARTAGRLDVLCEALIARAQ